MKAFYTFSSRTSEGNDDDRGQEKILAIIEIVVLVFLVTFIPSLIRLGRPPASIEEVWVELLVAIMASLFAYARIRGIDIQPKPPEE